ncbi:MAG: DUF2961 domain-containing protein, partial [Deltaproteobacteria bacterium]|nr:DUF2961 domain-containing protein [Deltaproteobacteria bacterium]
VWIDGENDPAIDLPVGDFVSGATPPFDFPVAGDDIVSSGGFYNYAPICFRESVKIATTGLTHFYNINFEKFANGDDVVPYDDAIDLAEAIDDWANAGDDPKPPADGETIAGDLVVAPGEAALVASREGAGHIAGLRFRLDMPQDEAWRDVRLRIRFDAASEPQVDAPLPDFFLALHAQIEPRALPVGAADGWFYCWFPMPFWRGFEIELANEGVATVETEYEVAVADEPYEIHAGHFHALGRSEITRLGVDYTMLDATGRGHYLGSAITMRGVPVRLFLEGDERVHVNGSRSPALYGTGTEDYYNGGWYFNQGLFTLPTHGYVGHTNTALSDITSVYRFHFTDPLPFMDGLHFGIEHDLLNILPAEDYRSVAYWYGAPDAALALAATIDVGDPASEAEADYEAEGRVGVDLDSFFEGDRDREHVVEYGYEIDGASQFTVAINAHNDGVLLRRTTDAATEGQEARVFIDGVDAGVWRRRGENTWRRMLEDDFLIDAALTRGKREIAVRFENVRDDRPWIELAWSVFTIHAALPSRVDALALAWNGVAPELGEYGELAATATYWDGTAEDVTGLVTWSVNSPGGHSLDFGRFRAIVCGDYEIMSSVNGIVSNTLSASWPCGDDEADDDASGDDDSFDDDPSTGSGSDDGDGCGC